MNAHSALRTARQYHQAGRLAEAEAGYQLVLATDPNDPNALNLLGALYLQTARDEEALDLLRRAVKRLPAFPEAFNNLGVALEARRELRDAEDGASKAATV